MSTKRQSWYTTNALLASAVLYYAFDLSSSGRTLIDWSVIGLVIAAVLWNLVQLGRRLHRAGGSRDVWHLQRTVLLWLIGVFNTLLLRPEDTGSWKNQAGWAFLAIAAVDSFALWRKEQRALIEDAEPSNGAPTAQA